MKRLLALASLILAAPLALAAPPSAASIEKLLKVTRAEQLLDSNIRGIDGAIRRSMAQSLQGAKLTPEGQKIADSFATKFVAVVKEEMAWTKMKPLYVRIYSESFSQDEIDGLLAFYDTPAGRAYIDKMPIVAQKSMAAMQERMNPILARMQESMQQAVAEAKAAK